MTLDERIKKALKSGKWMLRRSDCGMSYGGFQWQQIGEWTTAPDWNPEPVCGGGLHGNGPVSEGYYTNGKDIDFCIVSGKFVVIGDKGKCKKAMVAMRNTLPEGLQVGGSLDLNGTAITALPEGLQVGGYLDLRGTAITEIPKHLKSKIVK